MAKANPPSTEEWGSLFEAAIAFKNSACWDWMYDDDVFGVRYPETGEIAYCCVLGNAGEHFGLTAYLGAEGLHQLLGLLSGELDPDDEDLMFEQKSLICSFEDRSTLAAQDLKLIKDLGLKFRGRNQWPVFRHCEPGFFPWFLNAAQCRFLTQILNQALAVSLRCQKGKEILEHETPFTFLTRVGHKTKGQKIQWSDEYLTAEPFTPEMVSFELRDQIRLRKLKSMKPNSKLVLEADTFYFPKPVGDKGRPYYPKVGVLIDHQSGMALSFQMVQDISTEGYQFVDMLVNFMEQNKVMPSKILVVKEETYYVYLEVCKQIGLPLEQVEYLEFLDEFRTGMINNALI